MTVVSASMRADVERRADHRCEYCRVRARGQVATFPVDHVQPISGGGPTVLANLALTCPACNGHKWIHFTGVDPDTERICQLFNPRSDNWPEHFEWSAVEPGVLIGKSSCGRAAIAHLRINDALQVETRWLLAHLGLFSEVLATASSPETGDPT